MQQKTKPRKPERAVRWMVVFIVAIVIAVVGWLAFSKAFPERLVEPPAEAENPSYSPR